MRKSPSAFGFAKPEDSPGLLLWQTTITWQRLIKQALQTHEISHPQFVLLAIVLWLTEHQQEATQLLLISLSKLDKMTVSQSLKKLAQRGLVARAEHAHDARVKSVQLTAQGKKLAQQLVPMVEAIDAKFFGVLPAAEQSAMVRLLAQLAQ